MVGSSPSPSGDDEKKIADADFLFNETPKKKPRPAAPRATGRPSAELEEGYDIVEGFDETSDAGEPPPPPVRAEPPRPKKPRDAAAESRPAEPTATVDEVWSRGAEWGGSLMLVAIAAAAIGVLAYIALAIGQLLLAFLVVVLGGLVLIALCYPIFITLERPVRITPEQAVKDYYSMLSHLLPHYRRMWLLLSSAGRTSRDFTSYGDFCKYWKQKLAALQGGKAGALNPLKFQVEDFRSEKSAGMTAINAKFTVKVFRGNSGTDHEVASYPISAGLVKGPDRMWYLNSGTLPDGSR